MQVATRLMYGGFGGRDFARWLMHGTRTAICRVRAVELQRLYSRYPDLGAMHKPFGVPRTPESALYKRVIHPRAPKASQGRPDSAHPSPKSGRPRPFPSDSGMNFAFTSPKSDGIGLFLSDSGVRMRVWLSFGPSPSPVPVPAAATVSSPSPSPSPSPSLSPSLSPRLPAVGWR